MDVFLIGSLVSLGIWMNSKGIQRDLASRNISKSELPPSEIPSGNSPYGKYKSVDVWNIEQAAGKQIYNKSFQTKKTNILFEGPPEPITDISPEPIFQKIDYKNKIPLEYMENNMYSQKNKDQLKKESELRNSPNTHYGYPNTGGTYGINLLGVPISPENFKFNNMTPFFGSTVKQNVDDLSTQPILENFTGNNYNDIKKKEVGRFFSVQTNVTNPYGRQNLDDYESERYYVSDKRNKEAPIEKINVGPGLNQGYTSLPTGGFQQADTLQYVRPKTTNELRVLTNPKLSYYGRVVGGQKISRPGKLGEQFKNRPDTFFIQTPDRYMTTTGLVTGPTLRPKQIIRYTNRKSTSKFNYKGPSGTTTGSVEGPRPQAVTPRKIVLKQKNVLIPNSSTDGVGASYDHGKQSFRAPINVRQYTSINKYAGAPMNANNPSGEYIANKQAPRQTRKINVIGNNRPEGNMAPQQPGKGVVWDPNSVARTTIKETNIHNNNNGYIAPQQPGKGVVWDPNDIAKTTIKETNIHNNNNGYMAPQQPGKGAVWDPNDIAKTTIKETNIHNNNNGYIAPQQPGKGVVWDPNDVAKTTIKETNIHNNNNGYIAPQQPGKGVVWDPNDVAKTTIKEQTIENDYMASAGTNVSNMPSIDPNDRAKNTVRQTTQLKDYKGIANMEEDNSTERGYVKRGQTLVAPVTHRQDTSVEYEGIATMGEEGGYQVATYEDKNTNRQFTSDFEYEGIAGPSGDVSSPMSQDEYLNSTTRSLRQDLSKGREPNKEGTKNGLTSENYHATTRRLVEMQSQQLGERQVMPNAVVNSLPQMEGWQISKDKTTVPNVPLENRLDPRLLDAFKDNPYTQSLHSYVFP